MNPTASAKLSKRSHRETAFFRPYGCRSPSRFQELDFPISLAGRHREMGLGGLRTVDLARARALAREYRSLLLDGKAPIDARQAARNLLDTEVV
jgi:hypothetical protein